MKAEERTVGFILRKIGTNQFATIESNCVDDESIQISVEINFGVDEKNKFIACYTNFQLITNDTPFIILNVSCEFEVEEIAWIRFIDIEKNKIDFPLGFVRHLAVITIGTARGILHAKTEGSKFNHYFLPTINVNELVLNDASFPLDKKVEDS
jgi:hypothetical protein